MSQVLKRCAIYTRKSNEEGLDREFSSLDAQRELSQAYIESQRNLNWVLGPHSYDDGGYSGGNLNRPGLKNLLEDIAQGMVDVVLVYKIDRLSRSLTDFTKLIEIFDRHAVAFISVTQDFNTSTPMGRLSMNVLLSFAQYERELIGERIRDKYIASKRKGMWTGGVCPLGYKLRDKNLEICSHQFKTIREIFSRYLKFKSVPSVMKSFHQDDNLQSNLKPILSRGHIYKILKNPIYAGKVSHKGVLYDGVHPAIITYDVWCDVQRLLMCNSLSTDGKRPNGRLLSGKIFDAKYVPYSVSYTKKKSWVYHYYVSQNILQHRSEMGAFPGRIPAKALEDFLLCKVSEWILSLEFVEELKISSHDSRYKIVQHRISWISASEVLKCCLGKVVIDTANLSVQINLSHLAKMVSNICSIQVSSPYDGFAKILVPYQIEKDGKGGMKIMGCSSYSPEASVMDSEPFQRDIYAKGVSWRTNHFLGLSIRKIAQENRVSEKTVLKYINNTFAILG